MPGLQYCAVFVQESQANVSNKTNHLFSHMSAVFSEFSLGERIFRAALHCSATLNQADTSLSQTLNTSANTVWNLIIQIQGKRLELGAMIIHFMFRSSSEATFEYEDEMLRCNNSSDTDSYWAVHSCGDVHCSKCFKWKLLFQEIFRSTGKGLQINIQLVIPLGYQLFWRLLSCLLQCHCKSCWCPSPVDQAWSGLLLIYQPKTPYIMHAINKLNSKSVCRAQIRFPAQFIWNKPTWQYWQAYKGEEEGDSST